MIMRSLKEEASLKGQSFFLSELISREGNGTFEIKIESENTLFNQIESNQMNLKTSFESVT